MLLAPVPVLVATAPCADTPARVPPSSARMVTVAFVEPDEPLTSAPAKTTGEADDPVFTTDKLAGSPGCCCTLAVARL